MIRTIDGLHRELNANIHRGVHYLSEQATERYEEARAAIARFIGAAEKEEVIFTAGATASLNTVAYAWGDRFVEAGDNIVVSEMEHHSNIVPWQLLAGRRGAVLRVLPFDDEGRLCTGRLAELVDDRTKIVAVTQASNTLGTRPDLRPVVAAAHAVGAIAVIDGCQGVVHGGVDVGALDCDFYAFSGHKLYGPTGIGVLYGKRTLLEAMPPFLGGGDMVDRVSFEDWARRCASSSGSTPRRSRRTSSSCCAAPPKRWSKSTAYASTAGCRTSVPFSRSMSRGCTPTIWG